MIEIDGALIGAWNAKVRPGDHVWHLGDFALGHDADTLREIFDRLHGTAFLVEGNHDTDEVLALPWARPPVKPVEIAADAVRIVACHDPMRAWGRSVGRCTCTATRTGPCRTRRGPATSESTAGDTRRVGSPTSGPGLRA